MSQFSKGNNLAMKLSNEQVYELRRLYFEEDWSQSRLARHYQVNINTVGRIVRGESRQRVPMPTPGPTDEEIRASQALVMRLLEEATEVKAKERQVNDQLTDLTTNPYYITKR